MYNGHFLEMLANILELIYFSLGSLLVITERAALVFTNLNTFLHNARVLNTVAVFAKDLN